MGDLRRRCLESWRRLLPGYELKLWDESNSPLGEWYPAEAARRGYWSRLSNYVRLHAVLTEGGIYLDTDVELLRPFDPLLHHDCFLGFQQEPEAGDWVNTATFGARPGHPFCRRLLEFIVESLRQESRFLRGPRPRLRCCGRWGSSRTDGNRSRAGSSSIRRPAFRPAPGSRSRAPGRSPPNVLRAPLGRKLAQQRGDQALL